MTAVYPSRIEFLSPWVARFGCGSCHATAKAVSEVEDMEVLAAFEEMADALLEGGAADWQLATEFADKLERSGHVEAADDLRGFVGAIMPVLG